MDPVTVIVSALIAGAAAGGHNAASDAVRDAYSAIKKTLETRFSNRQGMRNELHEVERQASNNGIDGVDLEVHKSLGEEVRKVGADRDPELVALAQQLLDDVEPLSRRDAPIVDASRAKGVQVGNGNTQTNNFQ